MSLLAVDMGSSSCKAVSFSEDGQVLAHAVRLYKSQARFPSWSEMPAGDFWNAFVGAVREVATATLHDSVEVLSISSHGETFIPVDSREEPTGPAILNADNRATHESAWVAEKIGKERLFEITGLTAHAMYPLPKILWLRAHDPGTFASTVRFLTLTGYLLTRFGLPGYIDYSLASRFLVFDIQKQAWSEEILSACEMDDEKFPAPAPAGTIAGEVTAEMARELGVDAGIPVVLGGHDQPCAALGSGVIDPGRVSASLGTYECLLAASDAPAKGRLALGANLNTYGHIVPGRYLTLAYFPSGIMVDWILRLGHSRDAGTSISPVELCAALESETRPEPSGLCITPHLLGTCNPDFDPNASGVIAGIRPSTTLADLYQGVLEGVACEFASMAEFLQSVAGECTDIYISGGGLRSRLGLQLRAAMANRRLHLMQCPEAVCLGTAMLAGVAIGKYGSYADAVRQVVRVAETVTPEPAMVASYQIHKRQYQALYSNLAPWRKLQANGDQGEG